MARLTEIEAAEALLSAAKVLIVQAKNGVQTEQLATLTQLSGVIATLLGSSTFAAKTHTHALTDITELVNSLGGKADDIGIDETTGLLYLYSDGEPITSGMQISTDSGLSFDGGYVDTIDGENFLHLTLEGEDIEGFDPIRLPAGGGGSGGVDASISIVNTTGAKALTVIDGNDVNLSFRFTEKDSEETAMTDPVEVKWFVNNVAVLTTNTAPGNVTQNMAQYLSLGGNTVKVQITDTSFANVTKSFTWTVTVSSYTIGWTLPAITNYMSNSTVFTLTNTGATSSSVTKVLKLAIDGVLLQSWTNPRPSLTVTIPAQEHGAHVITAWLEVTQDGTTTSTDVLTHTGIWTEAGETDVIIASALTEYSAPQYSTTPIKWMAVSPDGSPVSVELYVGESLSSTLTVESGVEQTWNFKYNTTGDYTLSIVADDVEAEIDFEVTSIGYDINPVTTNLIMDVDPDGWSNAREDRDDFGYWTSAARTLMKPFTFSDGFDWTNGGFQSDEDGVMAFVIRRGDRVTFDRSLFIANDNTNGEAGTAGTGKSIELIFKTEGVTDYDAQIGVSFADNIGMKIFAHNATIKAGPEIEAQFCEGRKIELALNINPTAHTMKWWLAGTPAKAAIISSADSFAQVNEDAFELGSDDCDVWIYRFKMYTRYLNDTEMLDNFIADCADTDEMIDRYKRNDIYENGVIDIDKLMAAAPDLHIITVEASEFPTDKGGSGKKPCKITHRIGNGIAADQWVCENAKYTLQGTSSLNYVVSAANLDFDMKSGTMKELESGDELTNGYAMTENSIPVKYFNAKANVASSENANNVCIAELYNRYNPFTSFAKSQDSRVRDTVEGHPCVVFIKNTGSTVLALARDGSVNAVHARTVQPGETIMYFAGDLNNSKKNTAVFGQTDSENGQCCIEFMENNYRRCLFKDADFTNEGWGEDDDADTQFEFRYPDGEGTSDMKDAFIEMQNWVFSTDPLTATDEDLDDVVTYSGVTYSKDTAAYRKAKFRYELSTYFNVDSLLYSYVFTEFFGLVDNRAKNQFCSFEKDSAGNWRWNMSKDYDNDTALGIDNKGVLRLAYGMEDTDMIGESYVFNAYNSVLWCNIRDCFPNELAAMYSTCESAGLFSSAAIADMFDDYQRIRPETLMIEDYYGKYDAPYINAGSTTYLEDMLLGEKREQRRQYLTYQQKYMASKYSSNAIKADVLNIQAHSGTDASTEVTITPYSDMYVGVQTDNGIITKVRTKKDTSTLVSPVDGNGDPYVPTGEVAVKILGASNVKNISSVALMYPGQYVITSADKLQNINIGSEDVSYSNTLLHTVPFATVPLAKVIDLRGQAGISGTIDLSVHMLLEELYLDRTGSTNVYLPEGNRLNTLSLGNGVSVLKAKNCSAVTAGNFTMSAVNLTSIWCEGSPGITAALSTVLASANNLAVVRITDVDWSLENGDILNRITYCRGMNASGAQTSAPVLTGTVTIDAATDAEMQRYAQIFGGTFSGHSVSGGSVTITRLARASSWTVRFLNDDDTVLYTEYVRDGANAIDPVATGAIATPAKAPTTELTYVFSAWSTSLNAISDNTDIKAVYFPYTRYYTVRYIDGDTVYQSNSVAVHSACPYAGTLPSDDQRLFYGWSADASDVVADMEIEAVWLTPVQPAAISTAGDYLYTNNPEKTSCYTIQEFLWIIKNARVARSLGYIALKDRFSYMVSTSAFTDAEFVFSAEAFNHNRLADGDGFSSISWNMVGIMNLTKRMNATATNVGGLERSEMFAWLSGTVFPALPIFLRSIMKQVKVRYNIGGTSAVVQTCNAYLYLASLAEYGLNTTEAPYCNEIDSEAESVAFASFVSNATRIKKSINGTGAAANYWTRSPVLSSSANFYYINTVGNSASSNYATTANGVSFCFDT